MATEQEKTCPRSHPANTWQKPGFDHGPAAHTLKFYQTRVTISPRWHTSGWLKYDGGAFPAAAQISSPPED